MNFTMGSGRIVIDGREFKGKNVSIVGGKVTVDGMIQDGELTGDINVVIHGDVELLNNTSGSVTANNVGNLQTVSGDVNCKDVSGSIKTVSGDVDCGKVGGKINTVSGDVNKC